VRHGPRPVRPSTSILTGRRGAWTSCWPGGRRVMSVGCA